MQKGLHCQPSAKKTAPTPKRLAILISGSGSTAETIFKQSQKGELTGLMHPVVVISNQPKAYGLKRAQKFDIPTEVVSQKSFKSKKEFGTQIIKLLKKHNADIVSQNGWLPLTPKNVVEEYKGRLINQHPAPLDPGRGHDFGGKGMYGSRAICARIIYLWLTAESGWIEATTHYVTKAYDEGELLRVERLAIEAPDQPVSVQTIYKNKKTIMELADQVGQKLLPLEHHNVIQTLKAFGNGVLVPGYQRDQALVPSENQHYVETAKKITNELYSNH